MANFSSWPYITTVAAEVDGLMMLISLMPASTSGSACVRDSPTWSAAGGYLGRETCELEASGEEVLGMLGIRNVVGVVVVPKVLDRPRPVNTRNGRPLPST